MYSKTLFALATTMGCLVTGQTDFTLLPRQSSQALCGTQNGNTSCSEGSCCSQNGTCGIGRAYCDAPYCQFAFGPACDANAVPPGFNTSNVPRPQFGSLPYGGTGIRNCSTPGAVALTFDDGPYIYTADLLNLLKTAGVPATFFITGNNFNKQQINNASTPYPDIIRRMHHEGHQIASHTWSHQDLENVTHSQRLDQMIKNEIAFNDILGFFPTYFRPPFDECKTKSGCQSDIGTLGYHIINYNLDTYDYVDDTPSLVHISSDNVTSIINASNPKTNAFIIYAHDIYDTTVHTLTSAMISTVQSKGYKFVTIGQCLNDPRTNWYRNVTTGVAVTESVAFANVTAAPSTSSSSSSPSSTPSSSSSSSSSHKSVANSLALHTILLALVALFIAS